MDLLLTINSQERPNIVSRYPPPPALNKSKEGIMSETQERTDGGQPCVNYDCFPCTLEHGLSSHF